MINEIRQEIAEEQEIDELIQDICNLVYEIDETDDNDLIGDVNDCINEEIMFELDKVDILVLLKAVKGILGKDKLITIKDRLEEIKGE